MSRSAILSGVLAIAMIALVFLSIESGASDVRNVNVSLDSIAIGTGDVLTISYSMQKDYPAGQLYIRDINTNDQVYFLACPGTAGTHTVAWPCSAAEGVYYVIVFGVVNDSYQDANACSFTVDNSPPFTVASSPGGSGWRRNTVTLTSRDTGSGVSGLFYSLDNATWQQCSSPDTGRVIIPGGVQTLYFYAVDRAGNRETAKSVTYNVDDQPPATTVSLSGTTGSDGWYTSDVEVTLTASDTASGVAAMYYLLDGEEYTYSSPITLSTGNYWLTYWSRDNAGNVESPQDRIICVDTDAPVTTASPPGDTGRYINSTVTLTATGISGIRGLYYSFDGNDWLSCSSSEPEVGYVILPEGSQTLYYRAQGNNGLMETSRSATYMVDTHRPAIMATLSGRQGDNGWYNGTVQVTLTASDSMSGVAGISYDLDGSPRVYNGPFTLGDGVHSLVFRAADNAGNVNASAMDGIKVDVTPPEITCVLSGTISSQGMYMSDVQTTLRTSDNLAGVSRTEYSTDGTGWKGYAGPFTVKTGGQATVYFRCTDNAGNTAAGSQIVTFSPMNNDVPGNDPRNYDSTPLPTPAPALSPSPAPATTYVTTPAPTPASTPSAMPSATPVRELTGLNWLLLLIAILALIAIGLILWAYFRRKSKGRKRL